MRPDSGSYPDEIIETDFSLLGGLLNDLFAACASFMEMFTSLFS